MEEYLTALKWMASNKTKHNLESSDKFEIIEKAHANDINDANLKPEYEQLDTKKINGIKESYDKMHNEIIKKEQMMKKIFNFDMVEQTKSHNLNLTTLGARIDLIGTKLEDAIQTIIESENKINISTQKIQEILDKLESDKCEKSKKYFGFKFYNRSYNLLTFCANCAIIIGTFISVKYIFYKK
jgi:hypothetical protein